MPNDYITGSAEAWRSVANQIRRSVWIAQVARDLVGSGACLVGVEAFALTVVWV